MDEELPPEKIDSRHHQANERTLLAWLRTGIALMGVGLVAERMLFAKAPSWRGAAIGASLIVLGVIVNLAAALRFLSVRKALLERRPYQPHVVLSVAVALALAAVGVLMLFDVVWR